MQSLSALPLRKNYFLLYALGILLLSILLRGWGLGSRSLWFDESIEYWMVVGRFEEIHTAVSNLTHDPPFFSYLLFIWKQVGIQELWLRLPSLYASMLAIAGIIDLGRRYFGKKVGLLSGLLLAISAADVRYAQEVGQYAFLVCLAILGLIALHTAVQKGGFTRWVMWGALVTLGIYTHYGAAIFWLPVAVTCLIWLLSQKRWGDFIYQTISGVLITLTLIPLILFVIPNQMGRLDSPTLPISIREFVRQSSEMLLFFFVGNEGIWHWPWRPLTPAFVGGLLAIFLFMSIAKQWTLISPLSLLIITLLSYYLISRSGSYFFLPTRHALFLLPFVCICLAATTIYLNQKVRFLGTIFLCPIVLLSLFFPRESQEDLRAVTQQWLVERKPGDATYVYYAANVGFQYQLDLQQKRPYPLSPNWYSRCFRGDPIPECNTTTGIHYGRWLRGAPVEQLHTAVTNAFVEQPQRLWVVFSHINGSDEDNFITAIEKDFELLTVNQFEDASLYLFTRKVD